MQPQHALTLTELDNDYALIRFSANSPVPSWASSNDHDFLSVTRTSEELSIICADRRVDAQRDAGWEHRSQGWRCLRIEGATAPADVPGIIASVVAPLAAAGLSVFAVASFDTDHVLIEDVDAAERALIASGHTVRRVNTATAQASTKTTYPFRRATAADGSDLVLLADAATRRFFSWLWNERAIDGQSGLEIARSSIQTNADSVTHYSNWEVVERDGKIIAGLHSFVLPPTNTSASVSPNIDVVVQPLNELKSLAKGTWYISVASVFPEGRGQGIGTAVLEHAEINARTAGLDKLTLMVGSVNDGARRLYERNGFVEWDRRAFVPFPGSDGEGHWILMVKELQAY